MNIPEERLNMLLTTWSALLSRWALKGDLTKAAARALQSQGNSWHLELLAQQLASGDYSGLPPIELLAAEAMPVVARAYAASTGTNYVNGSRLERFGTAELMAVFAEELGHWHNSTDTPGHEVELFPVMLIDQLLNQQELDRITTDNDQLSITLAMGDEVLAEGARDFDSAVTTVMADQESIAEAAITWLRQWSSEELLARAAETTLGVDTTAQAWQSLVRGWLAGAAEVQPELLWLSSEQLAGARGAYDSTNNRILINWDWAQQASTEQLQEVFAEELGHWLDARFNAEDSAGDEGQLFAALLLNQSLSTDQQQTIQQEIDSRQLTLDWQTITVEQQRVYETLWSATTVNEDGTITLNVYLTTAPAFDVTVTLSFGPEWASANGVTSGSVELVFTRTNFNIGQSITLLPTDNLLITGNRSQTVGLSFSSTDSSFNGLTEALSVNVIDNDFQRSTDTLKLPSSGNNYIIYDYTGSSADYTFTNNGTGYDLNAGNDKLEITGSYQATLKTTWFGGNIGNDTISGATIADGGTGDDTLITFSTGVTNNIFQDFDSRGSLTSYGSIGSWTTTRLAGHTGNDSISAGNISLVAAGGSGADSISGSTTNDIIWGDGYEFLNLSSNYQSDWKADNFTPDTSWANAANNYFNGWFNTAVTLANGGADSINAGLGDDWIDGGGGNDTLIGGLGSDTIIGSDGNDSISGDDGNDNLSGGFGNDTINAGAGDDTITAADGFDLIDAGDGNNNIDAGGDADTITSGAGNDIINAGAGNDLVTAGLGNDSISAGDGDDTVNAGFGADTLAGGLGNDILYGNEDNDSISGNEGNDSLYGGDGADTLLGGSGDDRLEAGAGATNALYGEAGSDTLLGGDGNDLASGGDNDDSISGAAGNDTLTGDAGNDTLLGGAGNDSIDGGAGTDSLSGGDGADTLKGGLGADILTGGSGSDTFSYTGENLSDLPDTITDFQTGVGGDVLDLSVLHAFSLTSAGDLWSGSEFAYAHGYIKFTQTGADTLVQYDRDGLNGSFGAVTIATLTGVTASSILPGVNTTPPLSSKLYLLEQAKLATGLAEDAGASILYRAVLGAAPTANVTLTITGGDQITVNGVSGSTTLTFTAANWWIPQSITVQAADDLLIEGNVPASISHTFSSTDSSFNGLTEALSVNVIDNDFQRSTDTLKLPSSGNNYIIYDYTGSSADYTFTNNGTGYDLNAGNDKLEITGSYQATLKTTWFGGNIGNDTISGATIADGGTGDDTLITFSTGVTNNIFQDFDSRGSLTSYGSIGSWTTTRLAGHTGNDSISAGNISLVAAGGSGADSISGSTTNDIIWGDGYEFLNLSSNYQSDWKADNFTPDTSWANAANNYFNGWFNTAVTLANGGADSINAGLGDDWIDGGGGNDTLIGGLGSDTIIGSDGNDSISGDDGNDNLSGGFGNDTINAGAGDDTITAADGFDLIDAGDGNNNIDAGGDADTITSGAGNDIINAGAGNDLVTAGLGNDSISAGDGDDTVNAGFGADTLAGGLGNDILYGNEDNDSISGNEGNDSLYGGDGADTLLGGSGDDRLEAGAGATNALYGEAGSDTLLGGDGNDLASGGDNDDSISGAAGNDTLTGDAGNDTLLGGAGNDSIDGGAGTDSLSGGDGADTLKGGLGADILTGGSGSDTFSYTGENLSDLPDTITDFQTGVGGDVLDLSVLHAFSLTSAGDLWSGSEFAYAHGYIKFTQTGADTLVQYDRDGLNGSFGAVTIATLTGVTASSILPGVNTTPPLSSKLYLLEQAKLATGLAEDAGASILYRAVLGAAPTANVTLTITGGDQITVNGVSGSTTLTFTAANWWIPQSITVQAADDLLIEGNVPASISHTFSSTDSSFNGLTEALSVNVIDNDFQRSTDTLKLPSSGNNYIIYDYTGSSADYTFTNNGTGYDLNAGNDKLEITGSYQATLKTTWFGGNIGNDTISGATIADGGTGDDTLITFSTGVTNNIFQDFDSRGSLTSYGSIGSWTTTRLAGHTGNDSISAGNISLVAAGGSGADSISGSTTNDIIWGDGYEFLNLSSNYQSDWKADNFTPDTSWANAANNYFNGWFNTAVTLANGGADSINAGLGDDWIDGGGGNDTLIGGLGSDTIIGSDGNDSISGDDGNDNLSGGFGNDTINAGAGDDTITAADGFDLIDAGDGNNNIDAGGDADTITSGAGNDIINAGAGNDLVTAGLGNDSISAGDGDDTVNAGFGADTLAGGLGNDILYGNEDNDSISGNEGNDSLYGGDGADTLLGGSGDDRLEAGAGATNALYGEAGSDTLLGGDGNDLASGGDNDDSISGAAGNDTLTGDAGNDTLLGGAGNDSIDGGAGTDSLSGGDGADTLKGGLGADILTGGSGSDTFSYTGENLSDLPDTITDFQAGAGGDKLDLNQLHASNTLATFPAADYPFSLGYIRLIQDGLDTLVVYDRDGFSSNYSPRDIVRFANVKATDLTPENFVAGPASINFGFQRNGAILGITQNQLGEISYSIRLWGGQPSSDVSVQVFSTSGFAVGEVLFTPGNWSEAQILTSANGAAPTDLNTTSLSIQSNDVNYQGTGLTLGSVGSDLVGQRLKLAAIELSVFDVNATTREILVSGEGINTLNLPSTFTLISLDGFGPSLTAASRALSSTQAALTLSDPPDNWIGNSNYLAQGINSNGQQIAFHLTVGQFNETVGDNGDAAFSISGTPAVGSILTAVNTTADPDGNGSFSYTWQSLSGSSWSTIGSGAAYTLTAAEEGKSVRVLVSYTDSEAYQESVAAQPVVISLYDNGDAAFSISGTPAVGSVLTALNTAADPDGNGSFSYTWQSLSGSTWSTIGSGAAYTLTAAEEGKSVRVLVAYTDVQGFSESITVNPVTVAAIDNGDAAFSISGTPAVGSVLTALNTAADPDGNGSFSYTWQSLSGSTWSTIGSGAAYTLTAAEEGKSVRVLVAYTDVQGFSESITVNPVTVAAIDNGDAAFSISGTPAVGSVLTALNTAADPDGNGSFSYTWQSLSGSTWSTIGSGAAYTLTAAEEGKSVRVLVAYTDVQGFSESITVNPVTVAAIDNGDAAFSISGTPAVGSVLTALNTAADPDGNGSFSYTWQSLSGSTWSTIGSGAAYTLTAAEEGKSVRVLVAYTDVQGFSESITVNPVTVAAIDNGDAAFSISGTPAVGSVLTALNTAADPDGNGSFSYTWQSLSGSTWSTIGSGAAYTLTAAEEGKSVRVLVAYTDVQGFSESITVNPVTVAAIDNGDAAFSISGTPAVGSVLTALNTAADPDGNGSFSYTWQSLSGSTWSTIGSGAAYTLTAAEEGKSVRVLVAYTDVQGFSESITVNPVTVAAIDNGDAAFSISGTPAVGSVLTALNTAADPDGNGSFSYTWQSLSGSTWSTIGSGAAYTLTAAEEGKSVRVLVAYTDVQGFSESITVNPVTVPFVDRGNADFAISANPALPNTLTISLVNPDPDGNSSGIYSYQWQTSVDGISWQPTSATGVAYQVTENDYGKAIRARISYIDNEDNNESVFSNSYNVISSSQGVVYGTTGGDLLFTSNTGQTAYAGDGDDAVNGGSGNDSIVGGSGKGNDIYSGGDGIDTVIYTSAINYSIEVNLETGRASGIEIDNDILISIENIVGGAQGDTLVGNSDANLIDGQAGNDTLTGRGGNDSLVGGLGNDTAVFSHASTAYGFGWDGETILISDGSGTSRLTGIENLTFSDRSGAIGTFNELNRPATGTVNITGTAQEGSSLAASLNNPADPDGSITATAFQWQELIGASWTNLTGQTTANLSIPSDQSYVGKTVRVIVTTTDSLGGSTSFTGTQQTIVNVDDAATGTVNITGTAQEGSSLSASLNNPADPDGSITATAFQWQELIGSSWTNLTGQTTANLSIPSDQSYVGKTVRVIVTTTDSLGGSTSFTGTQQTIVNVDDAATGTVNITGTAQEGSSLSASLNNPADPDGSITATAFQWQELIGSSWTNLTGQTTANLSIPSDQSYVGKTVRVIVTTTDSLGGSTSFTGTQQTIVNVDDAATGTVNITGTAQEGSSLSASLNNPADPDGSITATAFQWQELIGSSWTNLTGQSTANLSIPSDQSYVGKTVRVIVTTTDSLGGSTSFTGTQQTIVNVNDTPSGGVVISGSATAGQTLTASNTLADADGLGVVSYQWNANGSAINGATASTYLLSVADVGTTITVTASYVDGFSQAEAVTSLPTAAIAPASDITPPTVTALSVNASTLTLTLSEALSSVLPATTRFSVLVGGVSRTVSSAAVNTTNNTVTLTLASAVTAGQTVTLAYTDASSANDTTGIIQDVAGNDLATFAARSVTNNTVASDITPPTVTALSVNASTLTLTLSEALSSVLPATTRFSVLVGGVSRTVSSAAVNTTNNTVTLTLASAVTAGQTVTLAYTDASSANDTTGIIQDVAGNDLATFAARSVTNNTVASDITPPTVTALSVNASTLTLTLSEALSSVLPATTRFSVLVGGVSRTVSSAAVNTTNNTVTLTLASAVTAGQTVTLAYTDASSANDTTGIIQDVAGNDLATFAARSVTNNTVASDITPPTVTALSVNASTLTLTLSEALSSVLPATTRFSVLVGGVSRTVSSAAVNTTNNTVTLTLASAVTAGQTVTLAYTDASSANDTTGIIQDVAGNDLATFAARSVTNTLGTVNADSITGTSGLDLISGGLGNDTLTGGLGADVFRFDSVLNGSNNVDSITDFTISQNDRIQLENTGTGLFTAIRNTGTLASTAFLIGTSFTSSSQRIRYDSGTGNLFYDSDGSGAAASILFATVSPGLAVTNSQFDVI